MRCDEIFEHFDSKTEGDFDPALLSRIENHVSSCKECAARANEITATKRDIHSRLFASAPSSLDRRVLSAFRRYHQIAEQNPSNMAAGIGISRMFAISRPAFALAVVILIVVATFAYRMGQNNPTVSQKEATAAQVAEILSEGSDPAIGHDAEPKSQSQKAGIPSEVEKSRLVHTKIAARHKHPKKRAVKSIEAENSGNQLRTKSIGKNVDNYSTPVITNIDLTAFQPPSRITIRTFSKKEMQDDEK